MKTRTKMSSSNIEGSKDRAKVIVVPLRSALLGFARRSILILAVYVAFATAELSFHWYAGTKNSPTAHSFRAWYLEHDPDNDKPYHKGYMDWHTPAEILGIATGIILARSWMWGAELVIWALFLSGGIIALFPFYSLFFPENRIETTGLIVGYVIGVLHCGFFIAMGRVLTAYLLERKSHRIVEKYDSVA
jgi:hypothetical protein